MFKQTTAVAQPLAANPIVAAAIEQRAAALAIPTDHAALFATRERREALLFLDTLSRKLRTVERPALELDAPVRERAVVANVTQFTLAAAIAAGAVRDPVTIAAVEESDAALRAATLGHVPKLPSGRADLATERRFGIARDTLLRPLLIETPPALPQATGGRARLGYITDEAEWVWTVWLPTGNARLPWVPALPVTHQAARAITNFSAALLDCRLSRGGRWDRVLDAARIRCGTGDRDHVLFDAAAFATWWAGLTN